MTDTPLSTQAEDQLNSSTYADALCSFIKSADTPVTIGIQGGWGSGKTSLITMLQEKLDNDKDHLVLSVMVNAWEHSLFHNAENKAEVALSLLNGLSEGIQASIHQARWIDVNTVRSLDSKTQAIDKALAGLRNTLQFASRVALQIGSNLAGFGDISRAMQGDAHDAHPSLATNVRKLKNGINHLVRNLTESGTPAKVAFFIDDLDRIPPPAAVEILDVTKNIFDMPNCVFVLAIDYEVIVKGLEDKFGKRTPENEREFRQYFDKIIQIPFTMPVGAYCNHLDGMLLPALERLGYKFDDENKQILQDLASDCRLATGGAPRGIKRIINTLSLLKHIDSANPDCESRVARENLEARFIIVALHINFPEICRRLMEKPNFPQWKHEELDIPWKLKYQANLDELKALEKNDMFDEPWEQVLYCMASQSSWLKTQAPNISRLLNRLRKILNNGDENSRDIPVEGLETLNGIIGSIRVVSTDTDVNGLEEADGGIFSWFKW